MSDQCKYCSLRGDIDKCLAQECKQDYWIVDYLLKEREKLQTKLAKIEKAAAGDYCQEKIISILQDEE
jgi:hypothetical protein